MRQQHKAKFGFQIFVPLLLVSCVSNGAFENMQKSKDAQVSKLQQKVKALEVKNLSLTKSNLSEVGKLKSDTQKLQSNLDEVNKALSESNQRQKEAEVRVAEFNQILSKFKSMVNAGKLKVQVVEGRIVVVVGTDILFASGSAALSSKGLDAIEEVAEALASLTDKKFQIEGHTDNDPIKSAKFPSNWELASARAISVVRQLSASGVKPSQLSAASFGENRPIQSNTTREGKAANRRIEIVVLPNLESLPGFDELKAASDTPQREAPRVEAPRPEAPQSNLPRKVPKAGPDPIGD